MKTVARQVLAGLAGAGVGAVSATLQHARWYVLLAVLVGFAVVAAGVLWALPWIVMRIKTSFADAEIECRRRWAESGLLPEQADRRYAGSMISTVPSLLTSYRPESPGWAFSRCLPSEVLRVVALRHLPSTDTHRC